ncbi:MAG TPA: hypothetical protein DGG95_02530 [Cytophagales bacterium]|nr:hypothetical protein [Cytophagales bacterium]
MIDPAFWLDEEMAELSAHARLLFIGMWGICDDNYATLPNKPKWISAQVFPYEEVDIRGLLGELSGSGRVVVFQHENKEYFWIKNFFKYQKVEKPSLPKYPPYKAINKSSRGVVGEGLVRARSKDKISKDKKREVKLSQAKRSEASETKVSAELCSGFDKSFKDILNGTIKGKIEDTPF